VSGSSLHTRETSSGSMYCTFLFAISRRTVSSCLFYFELAMYLLIVCRAKRRESTEERMKERNINRIQKE
jgi:hypothetical protein